MNEKNEATVYSLWHSYERPISGDDVEKFLGIYTTEGRALTAMERFKAKPGFRDLPNNFFVRDVRLDKDYTWREGFFVTVNPESEPPDVPPELTLSYYRSAPDGYIIYELIKNGQSLGCEVFVSGGNQPLAEGLGYEEAYALAQRHSESLSSG